MEVPKNHIDWNFWGDIVLKVLGVIFAFFTFRWLKRLFSMSDGKAGFGFDDFLKLSGFLFFMGAASYILWKEGNRPIGAEHIYSEIWLLIVFSGLLAVLHLDHAMDKFVVMMELLIRLRAKMPMPSEEPKKEEGELV